MPKNTNGWLVEDFPESAQVPTTEKRLGSPKGLAPRRAYASRSHFSKILRNLFSPVWLKLTALLQAAKTSSKSEVSEHSQSIRQEAESIRKQHLNTCFTDRVDPSLYYILFLSQSQPK